MKLRALLFMLIANLTLQPMLCANVQTLIDRLGTIEGLTGELRELLQGLLDGKRAEGPEATPAKKGPGGGDAEEDAGGEVKGAKILPPGAIRSRSIAAKRIIQIFIQPGKDTKFFCDALVSETIATIKERIKRIKDIPVADQTLFKRETLGIEELTDDKRTIDSYGIRNGDTLVLKIASIIEGPKLPSTPLTPTPAPEEKVIAITLPLLEYNLLYKISFQKSLNNAVDTFLRECKPPIPLETSKIMPSPETVELRTNIRDRANIIGAMVFEDEIKKDCAKYLKDHKDANVSDPTYVAINYFVPLCKDVIIVYIDIPRSQGKNLHKLTPEEICTTPTPEEKQLITAQIQAVLDVGNVEIPLNPTVPGFVEALNSAVTETMRLLNKTPKESAYPKVIKLFKTKGLTPKISASRNASTGNVALLIGFRKVLFIPKLDKLINGTTGETQATYIELKKYVLDDEQYLMGGISLEDIDRIILIPAAAALPSV